MARVFLDTNYFIDAVERRPEKEILPSLKTHTSFISPLSIAIYCYLFKIKMPNINLTVPLREFQVVEVSQGIVRKSLEGPTADFEDNIQLHSAVEADCDIFLTGDAKLLNMKFFGKARVVSEISPVTGTR